MFGDLRTIQTLFANFDNGAGKLREPNDLNRMSESVSEPFEALVLRIAALRPIPEAMNSSAGWSLLMDMQGPPFISVPSGR